MEEHESREIVQRKAAHWTEGAMGIISLLQDLDWLPLADRQ